MLQFACLTVIGWTMVTCVSWCSARCLLTHISSLILPNFTYRSIPWAHFYTGRGSNYRDMASVESEPITGSGAEPPAGSRGRAPGQGVRGEVP